MTFIQERWYYVVAYLARGDDILTVGLKTKGIKALMVLAVVLLFVLKLGLMVLAVDTDITPPTVPKNLKAVPGKYEALVTLSWNKSTDNVKGLVLYKVYRNGVEIGITKNIRFTDSNINKLVSYKYKVIAVDGSNNMSQFSSEVEVIVEDHVPPSVPNNLITDTISSNSVVLKWNISEDDIATVGYIVIRNGVEIAKIQSNSYCDNNVVLGKMYRYKVKAYDAANNHSRASKALRVKIPSAIDKIEDDKKINLSYKKVDGGVQLDWTSIENCASYSIFKSTDTETNYQSIAQTDKNTYTDNDIENGKKYFYKVAGSGGNITSTSEVLELSYISETYVGGLINKDTIWDTAGSPYIVQGNIIIDENACLTITPGTIIKFSSGSSMITKGKVNALGTAENKILFTSVYQKPFINNYINQYWNSITIENTGELNAANTKIIYGGNNSGCLNVFGKLDLSNSKISQITSSGININSACSVVIKNNTIAQTTGKGSIVINYNGCGLLEIEDNKITDSSYGICFIGYKEGSISISNNNISCTHPIYIYLDNIESQLSTLLNSISNNTLKGIYCSISIEGTVKSDLVLERFQDGAYTVNGNLVVSQNAKLSIVPGVTLKVVPSKEINVYGTINSNGTSDKPIIYTSVYEKPFYNNHYSQYWKGIIIHSSGIFNGENVKVSYGGDNGFGNIYVLGKLNLLNSEILNSYRHGITFNTDFQPNLKNNIITDNCQYGVYNEKPTIIIDASNNYWNSIYGPRYYDNLAGKWIGDGSKVSEGVIFTPWLGQEIKEQIHFGENKIFPSGNFSKTYTDISMSTPGFEIKVGRTYNSSSSQVGLMGKGWTFNFESSIRDYNSLLKVVKLPNGSVQTFTQNEDNTFIANDSRSRLEMHSDSLHVLTTKDQYSYGFNKNGQLIWMKDRNGNTITIDVDIDGKIEKISDQVGRTFIITYNNNGLINMITDPMGRNVRYEYDGNKLIKIVDPMGAKTTFGYDLFGYLNEIRDNDLNVLETIEYLHNETESQHRVYRITDKYCNKFVYSYDNDEYKVMITDSNDRKTINWYDNSMYIIKAQDAEGMTTITEYLLDPYGINKYGEEKSVTDRNGNRIQYNRDSKGNIIKTINPDQSSKEFTYDDKNNLIKEKDELGRLIFYIYDDEKINLLKKIQPLNGTDQYYSGCNESKFAITLYKYYTPDECELPGCNGNGLLKEVIDSEGNEIIYTYDEYGNTKTITNPENKTTTYSYNKAGWKTGEISPMLFKHEFVYDNNGRAIKTIQNNGETSRIEYDLLGRKTKEVAPNDYQPELDDQVNYTYCGNHGWRYTYYSNGQVETVTDPEDSTASYTYDLYGNVKTEIKPNGAIYEYEYDNINRLTRKYFKENGNADSILLEEYCYNILPDGKTQKVQKKYLNETDTATTMHTYDYAGRLVEQQNPDASKTSIKYNPNGTISTSTDVNGSITYYKYDGLNRLTEKWVPFELSNGTVMYTYYSTTYDKAGKKTAEKTGKEKVILNSVPAFSKMMVKYYTYFKDGKIKSITDSAGQKSEFEYDDDRNMSKETVYTDAGKFNITEYSYNHFGKPIEKKLYIRKGDIFGNDFDSLEDTIICTYYDYDKNGNVKVVKMPNDVNITYGYDSMDRKISISQPGEDEYGNRMAISTKTEYNWEGNVTSNMDENGNVTKYLYDKRGFLERKMDAEGGIQAYFYDIGGRKVAEVSPQNYNSTKTLSELNRVEYTYDNVDRVKVKTNIYINPITNQWSNIVEKAYKYDSCGSIIKELDALGYSAGIGIAIDEKISSGYGTEYTFNLANKTIMVLDPVSKDGKLAFTVKNEYDAAGRKISVTNAKGVTTLFYYDDADNITKISVKKTSSSAEQIIKTNVYDSAGNLKTQTNGNGNTTTYEYNAFGKIRKIIYPGDNTIPSNIVIYQYDNLGNMAKKQDSQGQVNLYIYDNQGRQLSHTEQYLDGTQAIIYHTKYDKCGNKRFEIDPNGVIKENKYNKLNRLIESMITTTGMNKNKTTHNTVFKYDKNSNIINQTDWRGNIYTNIYDPINRLIEKKDSYNKIMQRMRYYDNGLQCEVYDALGNTTKYTYDKDNRLTGTIDHEGHTKKQSYDEVGNISSKIDGMGNTTYYSYDEFNRLVSVTNPKSEVTNYTYDLNGNNLTQKDVKGNITIFEYNAVNKLVKRIDSGGRTGFPGSYKYDTNKIETYSYFTNGNIQEKKDKNGNITTYTYDIHNRKISQKVGDICSTYTYDNNGNMLSITDNTGTTTFTYDELNRVLTKKSPDIDTITYIYDIISNMPDGFIAEEIIDPKGNITRKMFDKTGRLNSVEDDGKCTEYYYYDNGCRSSIKYPNGAIEEYSYYKNNLLHTLTNKKADGTIIGLYSYIYDGAHNITSKVDNKGQTNYEYDRLNRLQRVTEPNGKTIEYEFDGAGNRVTETITELTNITIRKNTYNEQNRLTNVVTEVNGITSQESEYSYDNNGNQLTEVKTSYANGIPQSSTITKNGYDELNQLVKTITPEGTTVNSIYNYVGLRIEKTVDNESTKYVYDSDKVILELDGLGNQKARNVHGTNLISRTAETTVYYLYNGHGDVVELLDDSGQSLGHYYYDAFGNLVDSEESVNNPYTYAGYIYDVETKSYYLMSRMYNPETARFLQEDSNRGNINEPLSLNLYTYCHNEPLMYIDPTGHFREGGILSYSPSVVNEDVKTLQKRLNELGYKGENGKKLVEDGMFGGNTLFAVNNYKNSSGLWNYDDYSGKVGSTTWTSLGLSFTKGAMDDVINYLAKSGSLYTGPTQLTSVGYKKDTDKVTRNDNEGTDTKTSQEKILSPVYYSQSDKRWGSKKYSVLEGPEWKTANNGRPQDIAGTGCGPTSMAMVVSTLTGEKITPDIMSDYALKNGYRTKYSGTSGQFFVSAAKSYGLHAEHTTNINTVKTALSDSEHMVIASMGRISKTQAGHFTAGGHYIVLSSIVLENDDERFTVLDPNTNNRGYNRYGNDGAVSLTDTPGIVKAKVHTVKSEANAVGYYIFSK